MGRRCVGRFVSTLEHWSERWTLLRGLLSLQDGAPDLAPTAIVSGTNRPSAPMHCPGLGGRDPEASVWRCLLRDRSEGFGSLRFADLSGLNSPYLRLAGRADLASALGVVMRATSTKEELAQAGGVL
jgi:hypothetical protein